MIFRFISAVALAALLGTSENITSSWAQTGPAQAVKERVQIMKSLWPEYYLDMSRAARGENTDFAAVSAKAAGASEALKKAGLLFTPGSGHDAVPESRAKPEIWSQKAEFDAALSALITETNAMGEAAKSGNVEAIKAQYAKIGKACAGCHGGPTKSGGKFRLEEL